MPRRGPPAARWVATPLSWTRAGANSGRAAEVSEAYTGRCPFWTPDCVDLAVFLPFRAPASCVGPGTVPVMNSVILDGASSLLAAWPLAIVALVIAWLVGAAFVRAGRPAA